MRHPERVEDYLEHIAAAIERATRYLQPLHDLEEFQNNQQVQDAVIRNIEIIGEAVSKINSLAPDFVHQHPQIPWAQMRGIRNIVVHEYFFVDLNVVWTTVRNDLAQLKQQIDDLLTEQRRGPRQGEPEPEPPPDETPDRADGGGDDPAADARRSR
jgi:uncharacterized protein with HEPN domain